MRRLTTLLLVAGLVFSASSLSAATSCGCLARYAACIMTHVKPGDIARATTACRENFNTCIETCGDKKECRGVGDTARRACRDTFDERRCAADDESCRLAARRDFQHCVSLASNEVRACSP
jgi:hypothetical protein